MTVLCCDSRLKHRHCRQDTHTWLHLPTAAAAAGLQAMWKELDALDAAVTAERAARAKLSGKTSSH